MLLLNMSSTFNSKFFPPLNSALAKTDAIQLHLKLNSREGNVISEMEYQFLQLQHFFSCNIRVSYSINLVHYLEKKCIRAFMLGNTFLPISILVSHPLKAMGTEKIMQFSIFYLRFYVKLRRLEKDEESSWSYIFIYRYIWSYANYLKHDYSTLKYWRENPILNNLL